MLSHSPKTIIVFGESASGKTTFLQNALPKEDTTWICSEDLKEYLIDRIEHFTPELSPSKYIIIENPEDIKNKEAWSLITRLINELCNQGSIVIVTESRTIPISFPGLHHKALRFRFRRVIPTKRMVKRIAHKYDIHLSYQDIQSILINCNSLNGLENRIIQYASERSRK